MFYFRRVQNGGPVKMDVYDLDSYQRAIPHAAFTRLRSEGPVHFNAEPAGPGFWAITKYADVVTISKDPKTFSSARGGTNLTEMSPEDLSVVQMLMVNMDPPRHNKFRNLVSKGFTPRMIAQMEPAIRRAAARTVDAVAKRGECDFVRTVAGELPLIIIADLLGIPQDDRGKVFDWSNRLIGFDDPEFQTSITDGKIAAGELWMYANQLATRRREKPENDLTSVLVNANVDGEQLTELEFDTFFLMLAVAGNETTRNAISGGMLALIQHPEQRQRLIDDPTLIPSAVEEILRWVTPVIHFRRTAMRDVALRGKTIREGDKVAVFYSSANRDEEVFTDPFAFDVGRSPNEHLAFGVGQHFCLGASLARLELRLIFEELLRRLPDVALAGEVRRLRSNFINGIKEMPVRFTPEAA
jgi:cholest-4-en-3-one 26-monooxygenase